MIFTCPGLPSAQKQSRAPYGTPDWLRYSRKGTLDWLIKKPGKIDLESWNIREEGLVISKEKRGDLLIFLFQITRPLF
jgi:hypothetical protein